MSHRVILAVLSAVIAVSLALHGSGETPDAAALAAKLNLPQASCSGPTANVSFSWTPVPGAIEQWLDLSLIDNGFQPGTAVTSGPLNAAQNSFNWSGLASGAVYYWRVNARMDGGWATSISGTFVPCGGPVLLWGPLSCNDSNSAAVYFRWAPMATNANLQYLDLGSDPSFAPGSFAAVGPMDPSRDDYYWDGLKPGVPYFFRVNALDASGVWHATAVGGFEAGCADAPALNLGIHGSNDTFVFPRLGMEAQVNVRNVGPDGLLGDPVGPWDVVRYNFGFDGYGGYPGDGGTTVISGHLDYRPNIMAIFWELRNARPGDIIDYYRGDGVRVQFAVDWVQQIHPGLDLNALIANTTAERLVLITCAGAFNPVTREYDLRFVLQASRIH